MSVLKLEVLAKDSENDPLKRAQLIKDIAASIALIPDAIARTVYTQSTSQSLNIGEDVLIQEINKIRRSNKAKSLGVAPAEVVPEEPAAKKPAPLSVNDQKEVVMNKSWI